MVTSHDSAWYAAFDLHGAGARVQAIVDTRDKVREDLVNEARALGIPVKLSHTVTATSGRLRVKSVRVNPVNGSTVAAGQEIACDAVLMSGGWTPSLHLFSHTQGKIAWDDERTTFLPALTNEDCVIAGAGRGLWGIEAALKDGAERAVKSPQLLARPRTFPARRWNTIVPAAVSPHGTASDRDAGKAKAFVDYQNDVTPRTCGLPCTRHALHRACQALYDQRHGHRSGKMSNINGLNIAAQALGKRQPEVGLTTFRPPYTPTTFGAFAGYTVRAFRGDTQDADRRLGRGPWRGL